MPATFPQLRLRRLRQHPLLRDLVRETDLNLHDLIMPLFIKGKTGEKKEISTMPGCYQFPLSALPQEIEEIAKLGISSVILFGIPESKDHFGTSSHQENGIAQEAIRIARKTAPHLLIIADTCLCEYSSHGHCGPLSVHRDFLVDVDNDATFDPLVKQAITQAQAGADVIAPSGCIDGMVAAIRHGLDTHGFEHIPILSYAVKYHSALYGPFATAAENGAQIGDRSSYQMDPANGWEALREAELDVEEGADMLMVKPAHAYLDVIYRVKQAYPHIPLGAYHVSAEYSMIKAAVERGWVDEKRLVIEILRGIRRAGADFILSYYTKQVAEWGVLGSCPQTPERRATKELFHAKTV